MLTLSIEPYAIHSSRSQITFHIQRSEVIINNECVDDNEDDDRFCHHNTTLKMKFMKYSYDHNYYISTSSQTFLHVDKRGILIADGFIEELNTFINLIPFKRLF